MRAREPARPQHAALEAAEAPAQATQQCICRTGGAPLLLRMPAATASLGARASAVPALAAARAPPQQMVLSDWGGARGTWRQRTLTRQLHLAAFGLPTKQALP